LRKCDAPAVVLLDQALKVPTLSRCRSTGWAPGVCYEGCAILKMQLHLFLDDRLIHQ
jgi:hypothetical protein